MSFCIPTFHIPFFFRTLLNTLTLMDALFVIWLCRAAQWQFSAVQRLVLMIPIETIALSPKATTSIKKICSQRKRNYPWAKELSSHHKKLYSWIYLEWALNRKQVTSFIGKKNHNSNTWLSTVEHVMGKHRTVYMVLAFLTNKILSSKASYCQFLHRQ